MALLQTEISLTLFEFLLASFLAGLAGSFINDIIQTVRDWGKPEEVIPPRYFAASYGNDGLIVQFFETEEDCMAVVEELEERHSAGGWDLDSYTHGEIEN